MPLPNGTLLNNRYRIITILGQGGMGAVYRASDEHLLVPVAVKENLFLTEEYGRQFQREAHILAGLRHPNLPHVSDYFAIENQGQYLVMDYVEGEDLRQRMERMGALPEREAILIGISICDALTYLHTRRAPIVHRDIKPGNIKVTPEGQAVLVDFGLAKIMQGSQATSTGARAMTPGYSPPEQYGTARTDHRSDVYSLGATLYATLTGVIPEDSLQRMTGKAKLTPVRELASKVNRKLAETIERALEVDPNDRFQTAEDFKSALIESGELVTVFQDRPAIAPPPVPAPGSEPGSAPIELEKNGQSQPEQNSSGHRDKKLGWVFGPALLIIAAVAVLLFATQPDLQRVFSANLNSGSPTPTLRTEVASINNTEAQGPTQAATATNPAPATPSPALNPSPNSENTLTPAATAGPTSSPSPTSTPRGGGFGQIAYASNQVFNMQVWIMDVNTRKTRQITNQKDGACQPSWSPDGSRLAFISPCPDERQDEYRGANIYMINIDATGNGDQASVMQITSSLEGDFDPAWAPDGKRLAFTSLRGGKSAIYLLNLEDPAAQPQKLTRFDYVEKQPAWAPNGLQLAFVRKNFTSNQVWIMSDNGEFQKIFSVPAPINDIWPAWSPDGEGIYYSQMSDSGIPQLVYRRLRDIDTTTETHIPTNPRIVSGPIAEVHPSPDGLWLTYETWPNGKAHDIYIMSYNGLSQEKLTEDQSFDFGPVWRPQLAPAVP